MTKRRKSMNLDRLARMVQRGFQDAATKKELEGLATKKELEGLATKRDLESLATKSELREVYEEVKTLHADVRYIRNSTRNLYLLERDVEDLKLRLTLVEKRVGSRR